MSETKVDWLAVVLLVGGGFLAGGIVGNVVAHMKDTPSRPTSALTIYRFVDHPGKFLACFDADMSSCRLTTVIDVTSK